MKKILYYIVMIALVGSQTLMAAPAKKKKGKINKIKTEDSENKIESYEEEDYEEEKIIENKVSKKPDFDELVFEILKNPNCR